MFVYLQTQATCRPILDSFLPNLFQFGPTTPESHISDYHNQPRAHLNADNPLTDQTGEPQLVASSVAVPVNNINKPLNSENTILNPQIIGTILSLGRALFRNAFGNLFAVGQASPMVSPKELQAMKKSMKNVGLATFPTITTSSETAMTPNGADDYNNDDETSAAAKFIVMEPAAVLLASMQKENERDAVERQRSKLKLPNAQRRVGVTKLETIKQYDDSRISSSADKEPVKNVNEENNAGLILVENISDGSDEKVIAANNDSTEIIDAFFDLNADDIFYYGNGTIQRPRLFPLIISSLLKYRNQTEQGLLNDTTIKERHRIRLLYTLRPLVGVLRRKAENSKLRGQLRAMETWLEQLQLNETQTTPALMFNVIMRMRHQLSSILNQTQSNNKRIRRSFETESKRQFNDRLSSVDQKVFDINNFEAGPDKLNNRAINDDRMSNDVTKDNDTNNNEIDFDSDEDDGDVDDEGDDDDDDKSNMEIGETFSILMLELIGTVASLAYGAFNQLSHFIAGMEN